MHIKDIETFRKIMRKIYDYVSFSGSSRLTEADLIDHYRPEFFTFKQARSLRSQIKNYASQYGLVIVSGDDGSVDTPLTFFRPLNLSQFPSSAVRRVFYELNKNESIRKMPSILTVYDLVSDFKSHFECQINELQFRCRGLLSRLEPDKPDYRQLHHHFQNVIYKLDSLNDIYNSLQSFCMFYETLQRNYNLSSKILQKLPSLESEMGKIDMETEPSFVDQKGAISLKQYGYFIREISSHYDEASRYLSLAEEKVYLISESHDLLEMIETRLSCRTLVESPYGFYDSEEADSTCAESGDFSCLSSMSK